MSHQTKAKPIPFGQSTEKDVPFFLLNSVLGAWGQPKSPPLQAKQRKRQELPRGQQDLFGMAA